MEYDAFAFKSMVKGLSVASKSAMPEGLSTLGLRGSVTHVHIAGCTIELRVTS